MLVGISASPNVMFATLFMIEIPAAFLGLSVPYWRCVSVVVMRLNGSVNAITMNTSLAASQSSERINRIMGSASEAMPNAAGTASIEM